MDQNKNMKLNKKNNSIIDDICKGVQWIILKWEKEKEWLNSIKH